MGAVTLDEELTITQGWDFYRSCLQVNLGGDSAFGSGEGEGAEPLRPPALYIEASDR